MRAAVLLWHGRGARGLVQWLCRDVPLGKDEGESTALCPRCTKGHAGAVVVLLLLGAWRTEL